MIIKRQPRAHDSDLGGVIVPQFWSPASMSAQLQPSGETLDGRYVFRVVPYVVTRLGLCVDLRVRCQRASAQPAALAAPQPPAAISAHRANADSPGTASYAGRTAVMARLQGADK